MPRPAAKEESDLKGVVGIDDLMAAVDKKFGKGTLVRASSAHGLVKPRISTGSFALDVVTNGGFQEGGVEIIEGETGSSKSWSLHRRAANFQLKYPDAPYILVNAEQTNTPDFLEMLGVNTKNTFILTPSSGEEMWDVVHYLVQHAKKLYVGIDSLDACTPLMELEGDMDEHKMAPAARMNNKGFRKLITLMRSDIEKPEHRITLGIICQLRSSIGIMFGDPNVTVGGRGKQFAASMITRYSRVKRHVTEGKTLAERVCYALEIEANVIKNKGVGEGEKVRYTLYKENYQGFKRGEIDNITELVPFCLMYGIIDKGGNTFSYKGTKIAVGADNVGEALRNMPKVVAELQEAVKAKIAERHRIVPEDAKSDVSLKKRLGKRA